MNLSSRIIGTGAYLPQKVLGNNDFPEKLQTNHEWIVSRTGIEQRHIAADNELCSDLGTHAAKEALKTAGMDASEIDLILVATTTPDLTFPSTATIIQSKLNANNAFAFDTQAACAGFVFALNIADNFIKAGQVKNALVIGSETMSRILNWEDRRTCVLFGDGAGAVVLTADTDPHYGIKKTCLFSNGAFYQDLCTSSGTSKDQQSGFILMDKSIFKQAVFCLSDAVEKLLANENITHQDLQWIIPHQANQRIIEAVAERLKYPMDKMISYVRSHANTSAASIPLAMHKAVQDKKLKKGDLMIANAIGAGLTWGGILIRWG